MRISFHRTAAVCCGLALAAAVTLTGCSDDDDSSAAATTTKATAAATTTAAAAAADEATTKAVTDTFTNFFAGSNPPEQRAALVQKGDVFLPVLQAQAGNPQAAGVSVSVSAVKLTDPNNADVTYSLLMGGNPVLPNQTGQAVKEGGTWKVSTTTFCALMALQGGSSPAC
ncbi:hypothetical protein [Nocardia bovistercoris]|uniref:Low molecular weight antigen MTB12-like C-terminal domain-containing protein n=1 Tax=Nocardia bovistercoris TaxID=2785916 RepID=A0A931IHZ9_9NOCA|nr:hypothetical protein [Nocardia bovistercoris]MBH0780720.1 hypothetical protein [Nocardia bovistercoris]